MRLKRVFIVYLIISYCLTGYPQDWPKVIQEPGPGAYAYWFTNTYDNGFFIIGPKANFKYTWIVKTDINGDILWDKKIGNGQYICILGGIDQTLDGGFVVTGQSNKYDSWGDPVIIKFSACGEVEWCTVINTPGDGDYSFSVKSSFDSCFVMLTLYSDPNPANRIQLFKFDNFGNLIWRQNYPPDSLVFAENSKYLFVDSLGYLISAMCYYPDPGQTGGYERPYYIKTDTAGNVIWRLVYGKENGFHGSPYYSTLWSPFGSFYAAGVHSNYCDTPALMKFTEDGEEDYFTDLFPGACPAGNSALNFLNDTTFVTMVGGTINGSEVYKWIKTDTLGIEYQSQEYTEGWIKLTGKSIISSDNKIVSLSKISQTIYFYKLNSELEFDSIYTIPRTYDSLCPYLIVSDTVDPDCGLIVSIKDPEKNPEEFTLKVYPNPASGKVTVDFPEYLVKRTGGTVGAGSKPAHDVISKPAHDVISKPAHDVISKPAHDVISKPAHDGSGFQATTVYHQWGSATLVVYDLFGRKVLEQTVIQETGELKIDVSRWQRGMYVFRLVFRGETVATEKVVVE